MHSFRICFIALVSYLLYCTSFVLSSCFMQDLYKRGDLLRFVPCAIVWHAKIIFFSHKDTAKSIIYVWHIYTTYRKSISVKLPDFLSWGKTYIFFGYVTLSRCHFKFSKTNFFCVVITRKKLWVMNKRNIINFINNFPSFCPNR